MPCNLCLCLCLWLLIQFISFDACVKMKCGIHSIIWNWIFAFALCLKLRQQAQLPIKCEKWPIINPNFPHLCKVWCCFHMQSYHIVKVFLFLWQIMEFIFCSITNYKFSRIYKFFMERCRQTPHCVEKQFSIRKLLIF